ncbi:MAG: catalase [Clostridia bacterium]
MNKINKDAKNNQLNFYRSDNKGKKLTNNQGVGVSNTNDSLKAGKRGPTLMEDFHFREKVTHFDHERIPERIVHARGFGAHGYFELYKDLSHLTMAKFLTNTDVRTPVFVRFSTVAGSRGSADTVRDVRGWATKFYTEDGNYDLVGNNMPVFFIQDAIKFPDLIHSVKPEPNNDIPQASSAHDTFWDFISSTPESAHMVMWIMSDRAIPRSYRMMEGFGIHTYRLVNDKGESNFVKFHWKPLLGVHSLVWNEAQKIAGVNSDFHRRDLWDTINSGNFPEYEFGIQIIKEEDEHKFDFDVLDPTKLWPEEIIPVQIVGKMVLNRNVDNFFAETEQVAFCPANLVPGIDLTNDPLLQGRLFSYLDTQISRLGGPNFQELPINRPLAEVHNNQRDGIHRTAIDIGVHYSPNTLNENCPHTAKTDESSFNHYREKIEGYKIRARSESFSDHFTQATMFYNSMTSVEKEHIKSALKFELGNCMDMGVKNRVVEMLNNIDNCLAKEVATGIGVNPPKTPKVYSTKLSPALSQENTIKIADTLKVAILVTDGFDYEEVEKFTQVLHESKVCYEIVSSSFGKITSSGGKQLDVGKSFLNAASVNYDGIYIPSGKINIENMINCEDVMIFIKETYMHAKTIGANGEAVALLEKCNLKNAQYVSNLVVDKILINCGVITGRKLKDIKEFSDEYIKVLAQHKHWGRT